MSIYKQMLRQCAVREVKMRRYRAQGWSFASIGALYGVSRQRVYKILLKPNGKSVSHRKKR